MSFPNEIPDAIRFSEDQVHASYDRDFAQRFWRILLQSARVLDRFRTSFIGKCSPVHFFWGSFDLAVTRFSGRRAPKFSGAGGVPNMPEAVVLDAYSHEVSSAGFWPGGQGIDYPAFYSYASPAPAGLRLGNGASGGSRLERGSQPIHPALRRGAHRRRSGADPDGVLGQHL